MNNNILIEEVKLNIIKQDLLDYGIDCYIKIWVHELKLRDKELKK